MIASLVVAEEGEQRQKHYPIEPRAPLKRITAWENGTPVVQEVPHISAAQIKEIASASLALPYVSEEDKKALAKGEPPVSEFFGRPLIEVMLIKQARHAAESGSIEDVEKILDRHLGKPKTTAENHNINETYEDVMNRIAQEEQKANKDASQKAKDVTPPSDRQLRDSL